MLGEDDEMSMFAEEMEVLNLSRGVLASAISAGGEGEDGTEVGSFNIDEILGDVETKSDDNSQHSSKDVRPSSPSKRRRTGTLTNFEIDELLIEPSELPQQPITLAEFSQKCHEITNPKAERLLLTALQQKLTKKLVGRVSMIGKNTINKERNRMWAERMIYILDKYPLAMEAMDMLRVSAVTTDPFIMFVKENFDVYCELKQLLKEEEDIIEKSDFQEFLDKSHPAVASSYRSKQLKPQPPLTLGQTQHLLRLTDRNYRTFNPPPTPKFNAANYHQIREKYLIPENNPKHRDFNGALMREVTLHFVKMSANNEQFGNVKVSGVDVVASVIQAFIQSEIRKYSKDLPKCETLLDTSIEDEL